MDRLAGGWWPGVLPTAANSFVDTQHLPCIETRRLTTQMEISGASAMPLACARRGVLAVLGLYTINVVT